jgi:hypothetical protein
MLNPSGRRTIDTQKVRELPRNPSYKAGRKKVRSKVTTFSTIVKPKLELQQKRIELDVSAEPWVLMVFAQA